jgi:hypothetical protein
MDVMTSQDIIDALVDAMPDDTSARDRYLFRNSLEVLIRIARAEQCREINDDLDKINHIIFPNNQPRH